MQNLGNFSGFPLRDPFHTDETMPQGSYTNFLAALSQSELRPFLPIPALRNPIVGGLSQAPALLDVAFQADHPILLANLVAARKQHELMEATRLNQRLLMSKAFQQGRDQALASLLQCGALNLKTQSDEVSTLRKGGSSQLTNTASTEHSKTIAHLSPKPRDEQEPEKSSELPLASLLSASRRRDKANRRYVDASLMKDPVEERRVRGGVIEPFPEKLHRLLCDVETNGKHVIVSFFPHGRAFAVHNPARFVTEILPHYFSQSRLSSFQRQLNLYGFVRITSGPDKGGYYHELFLKGRPLLCRHMRRVGFVPPNKAKDLSGLSSHHPDFYRMGPPIQSKEVHMSNEDTTRYNGGASHAESMESTTDFA
jgi:HSF-type DNA-binding